MDEIMIDVIEDSPVIALDMFEKEEPVLEPKISLTPVKKIKKKPRTTPVHSYASSPIMKKSTIKIPDIPSFSPKIAKIEKVDKVEDVTDQVEDVTNIDSDKTDKVKKLKDDKVEKVEKIDKVEKVKDDKVEIKAKKPLSTKNDNVKTPVNNVKSNVKSGTKEVKKKKPEDTLSHIRSNIPNYAEMPPEEQTRCRNTFRSRYNILRDTWKTHDIPEIKDLMSLEEIHEGYEIYIKNIHVSQSTDKYKVYMVVMWLFIEYGCIQMGLNVSGYTMSQMKSMSKYERLLIELGEKNYKYAPMGDSHSDWPVELNILFMALANAAIFIVIKMLCQHINMGDNLANTIIETMSSYLSGSQPQPGNVLFNGIHKDVSDVPAPSQNPMGSLDLPSIISGLGNMFLQSQKPAQTQGKTPKFNPVYEE